MQLLVVPHFHQTKPSSPAPDHARHIVKPLHAYHLVLQPLLQCNSPSLLSSNAQQAPYTELQLQKASASTNCFAQPSRPRSHVLRFDTPSTPPTPPATSHARRLVQVNTLMFQGSSIRGRTVLGIAKDGHVLYSE
jgi:hypothetical protein